LEERGTVQLVAHKSHSIYVEFCNVRGPADGDEDEIVMDMTAGVRLGGAELQDPEERLESAVELAKDVDAVIAVVGLNADWYENPQLVNGIVLFWRVEDIILREAEGHDRTTLDLPGRTNELIQRIAEVNSSTIVVTQSVWAAESAASFSCVHLVNIV
jgi:beta-glucosidase